MIQDGEFWLLLGVSVVVFWLLPRQLRFTFLSLVSVAYIAVLQWQWAAALLGWALLFYWLSPLAITARNSPATRGAPPPNRDGRRWILPLLILGIVAYLVWFKYLQNIPQIR